MNRSNLDPAQKPAINLYSDTQTEPSVGMREAMAKAQVGDEQFGTDPTEHALCERVADLLGQQAAMLLPSGTMANLVATLVHCRPGDEMIAEASSHIVSLEGAGMAAVGGTQVRVIDGDRGRFSADQLHEAVRAPNRYRPRTRMVAMEQTTNLGGGAIWPLSQFEEVVQAASDYGLAVHLDGARLLNATVASGVEPSQLGRRCDSIWIDLTKGLGCPVGAVLAGSTVFIEAAWQWKQRLGGAMRQSGVLAAAGIYALDHNVSRLAEDHANARLLAQSIAEMPAFQLNPSEVESNIVLAKLDERLCIERFTSALRDRGVSVSTFPGRRIRLITHLDIDEDDIRETARILEQVSAEQMSPRINENDVSALRSTRSSPARSSE